MAYETIKPQAKFKIRRIFVLRAVDIQIRLQAKAVASVLASLRDSWINIWLRMQLRVTWISKD